MSICTKCGSASVRKHGIALKSIKQLDPKQQYVSKNLYIAKGQRCKCFGCGANWTVQDPKKSPHGKVTIGLEKSIVKLGNAHSIKIAAQKLKLNYQLTRRIYSLATATKDAR